MAEQEYFTWVDAQGRIHNTPKPASGKSAPDKSSSSQDAVATKSRSGSRDRNAPYLTEEEFAAEEERRKRESPPFFTWVDADGRVRNERIPQVQGAVVELDSTDISDHTLLPPLRVAANVRDGGCCEGYRPYFHERLRAFKPVLFSRPQLSTPFQTRDGERPAWYWLVPAPPTPDSEPMLSLRLRATDAPMALIVLDEQGLPLHFIPRLIAQHRPATWRAIAMEESLIRVADPQVRGFILYFPGGAPDGATLEVEWRP